MQDNEDALYQMMLLKKKDNILREEVNFATYLNDVKKYERLDR